MAKKLVVEIVGDTSSLERALGKSAKATDKWGARVQRAGRAAGVAGLAIGGALVVGLFVGHWWARRKKPDARELVGEDSGLELLGAA